MEAWLQGAALDAQVKALTLLLEGLSTAPAADLCELQVCVAAPPPDEDSAGAELLLTRVLVPPETLW